MHKTAKVVLYTLHISQVYMSHFKHLATGIASLNGEPVALPTGHWGYRTQTVRQHELIAALCTKME